jgi:glycosyltransferase involved in cell wall biosynthesis
MSEVFKFSVLISVYYKETPLFLDEALTSIEKQTLKPNEIVLVKDGPLTEALNEVVENHAQNATITYKIVNLEKNMGLGMALRKGLIACQYPWIARMDSDDISVDDRFEKQVAYLNRDQDVDVLGSWIEEFGEKANDEIVYRKTPCKHDDIVQFAKYRNPLNHVTVMFKKSAVVETGGYEDMNGFEDFYLWVRMMQKGYLFANIDEVLVKVRTGRDMLARRHGWKYFKKEISFNRAVNSLGFYSNFESIRNILIRGIPRLLPPFFLRWVYSFIRTDKT